MPVILVSDLAQARHAAEDAILRGRRAFRDLSATVIEEGGAATPATIVLAIERIEYGRIALRMTASYRGAFAGQLELEAAPMAVLLERARAGAVDFVQKAAARATSIELELRGQAKQPIRVEYSAPPADEPTEGGDA